MDDICETMDYDKFESCYTLLQKHGVKPLLAVVPFPKDEKLVRGEVPDFWNKLKEWQSEGCEIAVHGYEHLYTSSKLGLVCKRPLSEFSGIPYEDQLGMLSKGKKELECHGIYTDWFCAPGHSYDRNTLRALKNCGYKYMSDGLSIHPYILEGIKCIPADSSYRLHRLGALTICMHSNEETEADLEKLDVFLTKNQPRIISFSEAVEMDTKPYYLCRIEEYTALFMRNISLKVLQKLRKILLLYRENRRK